MFARIMTGLGAEAPDNTTISIDATYLKAHRTASSLGLKKGGRGRLIGQTKGGMNTKLHAVTDTSGRPIRFFISADQVSDYTGAAALLSCLPDAEWLLADRGYDADWFRETLSDRGTRPCIPGRKSRKKLVRYPSRDIALQCTAGQWTSAVTNAATGSNECLADSKTGDGSQPDMTNVPKYSCQQLPSLQPSYSGYES